MPRAVPGPKPEQSLHQGSNRKAGDDVAGPMREQDNPGENQPGADGPDQIAFRRREHRRRGCQRADMDGVARRKGVAAFSRQRNAVKVTADR